MHMLAPHRRRPAGVLHIKSLKRRCVHRMRARGLPQTFQSDTLLGKVKIIALVCWRGRLGLACVPVVMHIQIHACTRITLYNCILNRRTE